MLKSISLFCILLSVNWIAYTQTKKIDSLVNIAGKSTGKELVHNYNDLSSELRNTDVDKAIHFANKALELAIQGNYEKEEALSRITLSQCFNTISRYELCKEELLKAMQIGTKLKDKEVIGLANTGFGLLAWVNGRIDEALNYHFTAAKIFDDIHDNKRLAKAYVNVSMVYQTQNKLALAEKYARQSMELNKNINQPQTQLTGLHTLANVLGMQGRYEEALALDSIGLAMADSTDNNYFQSNFYDNMANCLMYSGRYDSAEINFRKCLAIDSSFGNKKQMSDTYLNLGNLYLLQKKPAKAIQYLNHSVTLSREKQYRQGELQALLLLSDAYKQSGDYETAFNYLKQAHIVEDSIINIASVNRIAELETVYQTSRKEQQLKLQKAEIQGKNFLLWGIAFTGILLVMAATNLYRKKKMQDKLLLQETIMKQQDISAKAVLQAEENERRRIAADLHDGVGQMMSAAKMNLSVFESELPFTDQQQRNAFRNLIGLVDDSCKEIRSVSHQMMPDALLNSGLAGAVKALIAKIDSRVINVSLNTEGLNEEIDKNIETILYRVIQECVTNVLKHAGANRLDISIIKDRDGIAATIEDNGKGFNTNSEQQATGIGLKNIVSRISYLRGTIDFDSAPGKGTLVAIHVPLD